MYGWLCKLFLKSRASSQCKETQQNEQATKARTKEVACVRRVSTSSTLISRSSSSSKLQPPEASLSSPVRWTRKYDVFVCHSSFETDIAEATRLVTFLEATPQRFRCFLWHRDASLGAAIPTELCQAMQNSHCRALLITPHFLQDSWCQYIVHQAVAEGPMSNRLIPLIQNLSHSQYPQELRCLFYLDLSRHPDQGHKLVSKSVLKYLDDMDETQKTCNLKVDSYSCVDGKDSYR